MRKRYHDLVILDHESTGRKQGNAKKLVSGILFFLIGIFVGALIISLWNENNSGLTQTQPSMAQQPSSIKSAPIAELQSITTIVPSSGDEGGCGIESLGRNNPEGCSADAFTDTPLDSSSADGSNITDLNFLDTPNTEENNQSLDSSTGVTNILDLQ